MIDPPVDSADQHGRCDCQQQGRRHHKDAELQKCTNADGLTFAAQRSQP
jgi:hypothetical protein